MKTLFSGKIRPLLLIATLCIVLCTFVTAGMAEGGNHCGYFGNQLTESEKEIYEQLYAVTPEASTLTFSADGKDVNEFVEYLIRIYAAVVTDHPAYRMKWGRDLSSQKLSTTGDKYQLTMTRQPYQTDYLLNKSDARKRDIVSRVRSDADRYTKLRDLATILWKETEYDYSGNQVAEIPFKDGRANGMGWFFERGKRVPKRFSYGVCYDINEKGNSRLEQQVREIQERRRKNRPD